MEQKDYLNDKTDDQSNSNSLVESKHIENCIKEQCEKQYAIARMDFFEGAYQIADERVKALEEKIMPRILKLEDVQDHLNDPAFLVFLGQVKLSAITVEWEKGFDLLTELVISYIKNGKDRKRRAGIQQAVKIIGEIDEDALCGLTCAHAFLHFAPATGSCIKGLEWLNDMFRNLIYQELPVGHAWLDHLDNLGAIRVISLEKMIKIAHFCRTHLNGYVCAGIKIDSDDYKKALDFLDEYKIGREIIVPNTLVDGYCRLDIYSNNIIDQLAYCDDEDVDKKWVLLTEEQRAVIRRIWGMYSRDYLLKSQAQNNFMKLWDSFESLLKFRLWWENTPQAFEITSPGGMLAQTNALRCDSTIPKLVDFF
jgi:hypothetical protein